MNRFTLLSAAAAIAASAQLASAQDAFVPGGMPRGQEPPEYGLRIKQVPVNLAGIDLDRPHGAKVALHRIDAAARHACGDSPQFNSWYDVAPGFVQKEFDACYARAMRTSVHEVGSPLLSRMFYGDSRRYALAQP